MTDRGRRLSRPETEEDHAGGHCGSAQARVGRQRWAEARGQAQEEKEKEGHTEEGQEGKEGQEGQEGSKGLTGKYLGRQITNFICYF